MSTILRYPPAFARLVMCLLLLQTGIILQAQSARAGKKVTIIANNTPIREILLKITEQTGYEFVYLNQDINEQERITGRFINHEVDDLLNKIFSGKGLSISYMGNAITLRKKNAEVKNPDSITESYKEASDSARTRVISISGSVVDASGHPLPGATILIRGSRKGTSANSRGQFSINHIPENATLSVSLIGYESKEIQVTNASTIIVELKQTVGKLDEAVVVAYNTTTQRTTTGAMTVIKGEEIQNLPNRSFDKSLQGLVPGLVVTSGSGQPGGGVSNFVLRGIATAGDFQNGSTVRNPLIIIDGIPVTQDQNQLYIDGTKTPISNPLAQLNPSDIESINVLKDASAISLYGSRASNGVIVVTTKKGRAGKTVFSFRSQTDLASRSQGKIKPLNQKEYIGLLYETYRNTDPAYWTPTRIKSDLLTKFPYFIASSGDSTFYPDPDWIDEMFDNHAITTSNELSMSGGTDKSNYYLNAEYTKQNGIVKGTGYDRKSIRVNFENRPEKWLKIGTNTTLSYSIQDYSGTLNGGYGSAAALMMSPLNPVRSRDGSFIFNYNWGNVTGGRKFANPVAEVAYNIYNNTSYRALSRLYGEASLPFHLTLSTSLGVDYMMTETKEKVDPRLYDFSLESTGGRIEDKNTRSANLITTNLLRFNNTFANEHTVGILLGQEAQIITQNMLSIAVKGLRFPFYDQITSPGVTVVRQSGVKNRETLQSFFAQGNYGFREKYLFSVSARRDGSSRFGEDKRYGLYWSTGIGWVASSEEFLKRQRDLISYLKVRGSIGAAGNAGAINALTRFDILQAGMYQDNTAISPTNTPANQDVQWEQTLSWDVGLEMKFWQDRLGITTDFYGRNTSDLIYLIQLPQSSGYYSVLSNIGKIRNTGMEISMSADLINSKSIRWNINANWSYNKNTLVKANVSTGSFSTAEMYNEEGENFNSFYLRKWAGVNPENGMSEWIDSVGKPNSDYNAAKREIVGKPQPDGYGSVNTTLNYKGIELSVSFYYQYGCQIYNNDKLVNDGLIPYMNQDKRALNRWQKAGDIAANPKRTLNNNYGEAPSTRYLYSGDYIRLQNVAATYSLPRSITSRLGVRMIRIYIQGNNLALWSKSPGEDPNNVSIGGTTSLSYPMQRAYSAGLNINF